MIKKLSFILVLAFVVGAASTIKWKKPIIAQAVSSNPPQFRYAGSAINIGQPVTSSMCPIGVSTTQLCVTPTSVTGLAAGISIQTCNTGDLCQIMMTGVAIGIFDNTPFLNAIAINNAGVLDAQAGNLYNFSNLQGCVGRVTGLIDSTHAWVTMFHPASPCYGIDISTITPALATVATSGSYPDLINKPTIGLGSVTSFSANAWPSWLTPTVSAATTTPALTVTSSAIPNSALANTSTTVNGQACILGSTCTVGIGVTLFSAGTWPAWLTPTITNSTTTPSLAVAASVIPNSALANSSVAVSGQTCTLGSACTVPQNVSYYNGTTLVTSPVKCAFMTGTTNGSGVFTFNYSALGFTTLLGLPQPTVQGTGTNPSLVNIQGTPTTTSTTVYASVASIISVVGINVTLIGLDASAPVGLWVCGS